MTLKEFYAAVGGDYDATLNRIPKESMVLRFAKKYADDKTYLQLTEAVNPFNPNAQQMYSQLQGMGMTEQQSSGWIAQQITNQGLIISANEICWISAGIFIVLLGLVWFARPPFGAGGGGGGAH